MLQVNTAACIVTSVVYKGVNTTGFAPSGANNSFSVLPTPADDKIFIKYAAGETETLQFSVTDLSGNILTSAVKKGAGGSSGMMVLDLPSGIAAGNYFVKMICGSRVETKPFTVSH